MTQEIEAVGKGKKDKNGLTQKQKVFVENVARGYDANSAAKLAGYAHPDQEAWRLMENENVLQALSENISKKITGLAPIALNGVQKLITDEKTPAGVKLNACKYILDTMRDMQSVNEINNLNAKDMQEMSPEELKAFIQSSRRVIMREVIADNTDG